MRTIVYLARCGSALKAKPALHLPLRSSFRLCTATTDTRQTTLSHSSAHLLCHSIHVSAALPLSAYTNGAMR